MNLTVAITALPAQSSAASSYAPSKPTTASLASPSSPLKTPSRPRRRALHLRPTGLLEKLLDAPPRKTTQLTDADVGASIASAAILPRAPSSCLFHGHACRHCQRPRQLAHRRAADVTLKERRPLLLCVRETPSIASTCAT